MASRQEDGKQMDDSEQGILTSATNLDRSMEADFSSDFLESNANGRDDTVVDKMKYDKLGKMLKQLNMKVTSVPEDMSKLKQRLFSGPWTPPFSQVIRDGLNETVQKYKRLKQGLIQHSSELLATVEDEFFATNMSELANSRYPDYEKELKAIKTVLQNMTDEFEIAFIGETSSGKSTFLNVLLEGNVLPSAHLHKTASVCRLRNSENRKIEYIAGNNIVEKITLTGDSSELRSRLDSINQKLLSKENDDEPLKMVDIYWPIPLLHENVVLTDTPGIGERDPLTKRVLEYLPKCAGYVFIINSANAGGVGACIQNMIQMIGKSASKENHEMDLSNSIFVCNKWDQIEVKDRGKVLEDTKKKISKYSERLDDCQILQINSKLELKLIEWKANSAGDFKILQKSLNSLMIRTIEKRLRDVFRGLRTFAKEVGGFVNAMIKGADMSKEEFQKNSKETEDQIDLASNHLIQFNEVDEMVGKEETFLLHTLQKHLETQDVQRRICNWTDIAPLLSEVDEEGPELIAKSLQNVMFEWAADETGPFKQASNRITDKCREIQAKIDSTIININNVELGFRFVDRSDERVRLSGKCSVLSVIRHNLWQLASIIFTRIGPRSLSSWAREKATQAAKQRSIEKITSMTSKATEILLTENQLRIFITDSFTSFHTNRLTEFKQENERVLDSAHETIKKIKTNLNMNKVTQDKFKTLQAKLSKISEGLLGLENQM